MFTDKCSDYFMTDKGLLNKNRHEPIYDPCLLYSFIRGRLFDYGAVVFAASGTACFVGFRDIELLDADFAQHLFEMTAGGEDDFTVAQYIRRYILFFFLAFTAEGRTKSSEIPQFHREVIGQIPFEGIYHAVDYHFYYTARHQSYLGT